MNQHQPVLVHEVVEYLNPQVGEVFFDGTAGYGGHAKQILGSIGTAGRMILVDRDQQAIKYLKEQFTTPNARIVYSSYLEAAEELQHMGETLDMALLDLGVSSPQIDNSGRGFSFRQIGPLDMRMDQEQEVTAHKLVNELSETELAEIIFRYGEERRSRQVAKSIVDSRPLGDTGDLATAIHKAVRRVGKIDPATKTFQAIRIAVNDELAQLSKALPILTSLLKPGGRLAVISFHSLEDRIVKQFLKIQSADCVCPPEQPVCSCAHQPALKLLTKGAVIADETEINLNPRARSAKLRVAVKLKPKQKEEV